MNNLVCWLAISIKEHVAETRFGVSAKSESRLIFHGPPLEILSLVYEALVASEDGALIGLPVLLQVPSLRVGEVNPRIGASGRCDESHLLDLRNSPNVSSYLALVPPGQHAIRSVSSTTDEFGVATASNGGNVAFDDWLADSFIQRTIEAAVDATHSSQIGDAVELVQRSLHAIDDVDAEKSSHLGAWRLISRIFAISSDSGQIARQISLACGVPPMANDKLSPKQQLASLEGIAAALSDGFKSGLSDAKGSATAEQQEWLEAFLSHIRSTCDVPTALERAPQAFYTPSLGPNLSEPPSWWTGLTVELWTDLLADEPEFTGDIQIECQKGLLPSSKGVPVLVADDIELVVRVRSDDGRPVDVVLERSPGKKKDGFPASLGVEGETNFRDKAPPLHKSPIQYKASAENYRPATVKVVSLATWQPGIFVGCRVARRVSGPRAPARRTRGPQWETSLTLPGPGRFELVVFIRPGGSIANHALGSATGDGNRNEEQEKLAIREVRQGVYQIEVEAEGSHQVDVAFDRPERDGKTVSEICRVFLVCEDIVEDGCRSEFERLIKLNRRPIEASSSKPLVQLNRSVRCTSLQGWMLQDDQVGSSFLPLVLAEDYADRWVQPDWSKGDGRILSGGKYLRDPRPPASDFDPPDGFVEARKQLAKLVRGSDDESGLLEAAQLGDWLKNDADFQAVVEEYLETYTVWLKASPDVASWVDVVAITSLEPDGRTLSRVPDAVLLSPLHPLRIAWHSLAQRVLYDAALGDRPCPAGGVLDPRVVPDIMWMPLISPEGIERVPFLSVECNSDYWSVLWNGTRLRSLSKRSQLAPFGPEFGLSVGGITTGFSASQMTRALNDVSNILCAKPTISVVVSSAGGTTDACNDGLIEWSSGQYVEAEKQGRRQASGPRRLDVFDAREQGSRPDDATVGNLSDDTGNNVRWFSKLPAGVGLDLGIIAQLDSSEPEAAETFMRSALGAGGLLRHRVRRQLPGSFLSESRQSHVAASSGDPLGDKIAACIALVENAGERLVGLRFAPNVHAISDMLEEKKTDFVAISSSAVDPACFLGGWLEHSYLWDYDLPSYSQRAGDTNGYYVLSKVKPSDRDGMRKVLSRLPGCSALDDAKIGDILLEVARRGIPTIRGLSGDNTGATGDLGLFVAARLLQDRFRLSDSANSLLPVIGGTVTKREVSLVIPVDPFRGYLDDLSRALYRDRSEGGLARPDLIVVGIALGQERAHIHVTPVEVKSRMGSMFPPGDVQDALGQAKALADLLTRLSEYKEPLTAWRLAYQHLLLAIIGFGMRVYSQHQELAGAPGEWAGFHEKVANAILDEQDTITVDRRGRLIIVDDTRTSEPRDYDRDGFEETIVIGLEDAGRIVAGDAQIFYDGVRAKVGDWELTGARELSGAPQPTNSGCNGAIARTEPDATAQETQQEPETFSNPKFVGPAAPQAAAEPQQAAAPVSGIRLSVGRSDRAFEQKEFSLEISDTRLNQLNMGVVGDLGTGKTQLLKSLVYQIVSAAPANRGIRPRIMIFDYKRDYSSQDFVQATAARVVRPYRLPLNLFNISSMEDATVPWLDRFRCKRLSESA